MIKLGLVICEPVLAVTSHACEFIFFFIGMTNTYSSIYVNYTMTINKLKRSTFYEISLGLTFVSVYFHAV